MASRELVDASRVLTSSLKLKLKLPLRIQTHCYEFIKLLTNLFESLRIQSKSSSPYEFEGSHMNEKSVTLRNNFTFVTKRFPQRTETANTGL